MESNMNAVQPVVNLGVAQDSVQTSNRTHVGYRSAVAAGAPPVDGLADVREETPLLSRTDTFEAGTTNTHSFRRSSSGADGRRQHSPPSWQSPVDGESLPWYNRPAVGWLFLPFFLFALSFGGTIVPQLTVITQLICQERMAERITRLANSTVSSDPTSPSGLQETLDPLLCSSDKEVVSAVSIFMLWGTMIAGILSAVTSPKLGALSDRFGRLPILGITICGAIAREAFFILLFLFPQVINFRWLLVAYAFDGMCGSYTTAMAVVNAYASDCTAPKKRAVVFGRFQGCLFIGIALGPIVAAYVVKWTGNILNMFYIAAGTQFLFLLSAYFVIPESLSKARQKEAREEKRHRDEALAVRLQHMTDSPRLGRAAVFLREHNILAPLKILFPTGPGTSPVVRRNMVSLAAVDTVMFGVAMGAMTVTLLYTGEVFHWDQFDQNKFITIVNIARVTCILFILPAVTRIFRGRSGPPGTAVKESGCDGLDVWLIRVGVAFDMMGFIGYATAPTGELMILGGVLASVGGIASPTLQSSLTKHVPPGQVGQLLGASGLLHALARVVSPMICNWVFSATNKRGNPNVVFIMLASAFGLALIVSIFIRKGVYIDARGAEDDLQQQNRDEEGRVNDPASEESVL